MRRFVARLAALALLCGSVNQARAEYIDVLHVGGHPASWQQEAFRVMSINPTQFATRSLEGFHVLYVDASAYRTAGWLSVLQNRAADIAAFVNSGGGLVTDNGGNYNAPHYSWVPNASAISWTTSHQEGVLVTQLGKTHPVTTGLTDSGLSHWGNSQHNYFPLTGGMDVLATNPAGQANLLAGNSGSGRLVYFGLDPSYHQGSGLSTRLIRQGLTWASGVSKVETIETPEPASLTLAGLGALGVAGCAWRRKRRA